MFIGIQNWADEISHKIFGLQADAEVTLRTPVSTTTHNVMSIAAYEEITIRTTHRPGTKDNKSDILHGYRVKFFDGTTKIVIDTGASPSFLDCIKKAATSKEIVMMGESSYYKDTVAIKQSTNQGE